MPRQQHNFAKCNWVNSSLLLFGIGIDHDELIAREYVKHFANFQGSNLAGANWSNCAVGGIQAERMRRNRVEELWKEETTYTKLIFHF